MYDESGTDDFKEINNQAETLLKTLAVSYIDQCVQHQRVLPLGGLIDHHRTTIKNNENKVNKIKSSIITCKHLHGRIKRKDDETNMFETIIDEQLSTLETNLITAKKNLTISKKVFELLNQYESIGDLHALINSSATSGTTIRTTW